MKNRCLNLDDRKKIEELLHSGVKHVEIIKQLEIHATSFYRELKKCKEEYNAEEAQRNTRQSKNFIDWEFIGKKFGLLTVLEFANIYKKRSWWKCRCDCGKECIMSRRILVEYCSDRRKLSCGCIPKQCKGGGNKVPIEEAALRKYQDLLNFRRMDGECWEWTGYVRKNTPRTSWKNVAMSVRKCMYMLMNGLTEELNPIFTTCGNKLCFNPDHLTAERPKKRYFYK